MGLPQDQMPMRQDAPTRRPAGRTNEGDMRREVVPEEPQDTRGGMDVTTDSPAYCQSLSGLIASSGRLPPEVSELKDQGDGLCDAGKVRGGINRLRRALLVLHHGAAEARPGD